jgi:hypothetical protein
MAGGFAYIEKTVNGFWKFKDHIRGALKRTAKPVLNKWAD